MQFYRRCILITSVFAILSGCTSLKVPTTQQPNAFQALPTQQRIQTLLGIQQWNIDGAFSVQYGQQVNIANYAWQQIGSSYQIQIHSSLNIYSIKIQGQLGQVTLIEAQKQPVSASSAEELMQDRLGWSLPVSNLQYWIRGIPAPGDYQSQVDVFGHLTQVTQQGWFVGFSNYTTVQSYDLPRTLLVQGHGLKIKIVIKNWNSVGA